MLKHFDMIPDRCVLFYFVCTLRYIYAWRAHAHLANLEENPSPKKIKIKNKCCVNGQEGALSPFCSHLRARALFRNPPLASWWVFWIFFAARLPRGSFGADFPFPPTHPPLYWKGDFEYSSTQLLLLLSRAAFFPNALSLLVPLFELTLALFVPLKKGFEPKKKKQKTCPSFFISFETKFSNWLKALMDLWLSERRCVVWPSKCEVKHHRLRTIIVQPGAFNPIVLFKTGCRSNKRVASPTRDLVGPVLNKKLILSLGGIFPFGGPSGKHTQPSIRCVYVVLFA